MSEKTLLEKEYQAERNCCRAGQMSMVIDTKNVVEALRKFQSAEFNEISNMLCCNCKSESVHFYDEINNLDYCLDCWFKECFGELPKFGNWYN